ncbi:hypothetical protein GCM10009731_30960 [Streptomyces globosus]
MAELPVQCLDFEQAIPGAAAVAAHHGRQALRGAGPGAEQRCVNVRLYAGKTETAQMRAYIFLGHRTTSLREWRDRVPLTGGAGRADEAVVWPFR